MFGWTQFFSEGLIASAYVQFDVWYWEKSSGGAVQPQWEPPSPLPPIWNETQITSSLPGHEKETNYLCLCAKTVQAIYRCWPKQRESPSQSWSSHNWSIVKSDNDFLPHGRRAGWSSWQWFLLVSPSLSQQKAAAVKTFPCAEAIHRGVNIDLSTKLWHEWYISAARVEKCSGKNTILYVLIQLMFWPSSRRWFDCGLLPIPKVSKIVHQPGNQNSQSIRHCIDKRRHRRARDIKR